MTVGSLDGSLTMLTQQGEFQVCYGSSYHAIQLRAKMGGGQSFSGLHTHVPSRWGHMQRAASPEHTPTLFSVSYQLGIGVRVGAGMP